MSTEQIKVSMNILNKMILDIEENGDPVTNPEYPVLCEEWCKLNRKMKQIKSK